MKISDFSIQRPVFTMVTMLFVIILGIVSLTKIPITLIPDLNPPIGVVVTNYSGASPTEVNEKVTKPLETVLATLPNIKRLQSTSQEGASLIVLEFDWSANMDDVQLDILQRLDLALLPTDAGKPSFLKFDPSQFPIIQLSLQATSDEVDIRRIAEQLEQELLRTDGVASVNVSGKIIEEIQIRLNADKLEQRGLTQADIVQLVQANNISMPGQAISTEDDLYLNTRIISLFHSAEELEQLIVSIDPLTGEPLRLQDVATVQQVEQQQQTITRANDNPAVLLSVLQESDANTAEVSDQFQQSLASLLEQPQYANVRADLLFDQGDYVRRAISNIGSSLIYGGIFAMLVLFVFLRNIRSPIIIGVAIPYSVIVTFVLMYFANFTLNILTLGALALGIGMLVDNAIVVIENIERHLAMGKTKWVAALEGTKEVAAAIMASTLTTVAVFIPVIFISGLIGQLFVEFALTISFSLFASLAVALTVIPMLASRYSRVSKHDHINIESHGNLYSLYRKALKWSLQHRLPILGMAIVLLAISFWMVFRTGTEFIPSTDEGFVEIEVTLPKGSSLDRSKEIVTEIEQLLMKQSEVDVVVSLIGADQQALSRGQSLPNSSELYVKLIPLSDRERSVFQFSEELEAEVKAFVGDRAEVEFSLSNSSGSTPNTLTFRATDTDEVRLKQTVSAIQQQIEEIPTVTEVTTDLDNVVQEVQVKVNQQAATEYGFAAAQIAQTVNNMMSGQLTTQLLSENGEVLLVYTHIDERYNDLETLKRMKLRSPAGVFVELQQLADITLENTQTSIRRSDQAAAVALFVKYATSESLSGISNKVDAAIEKAAIPSQTRIIFGGDRELFDSAKQDMILAVILAVILVYLVMAAQFESFKYPFIMLFSVPLMVIGVAFSLWLTNTLLGVTAIIGILVLVGIVVNNGIVLVDFINQLKGQGISSFEAIVEGAVKRLRPILMTALTTILGLIPLALGIGEGTELNQPMAIVVIGGLLVSTFLTLFIVPIIYSYMDRVKMK